METDILPRHQLIKLHAARQSDTAAEAAVYLWGSLATGIISIVGEGGFDSLYARSIFLTQSTYPWLDASVVSPRSDNGFARLKASLEAQSPALALEANSLLLITFTDILASLVGEPLMARILDSAWGPDGHPRVAKESKK